MADFARFLEVRLGEAEEKLTEMRHSANCAYCGASVDRTAGAMAEHSMSCEKHPIHLLQKVVVERDHLKQQLAEAMEDTKRLIKLADMIWDGRWMDDKNHLPEMDVEYQTLVGIAAEIRSGNYTMIDVAVAEHGTLIRAQKLIGEKDV